MLSTKHFVMKDEYDTILKQAMKSHFLDQNVIPIVISFVIYCIHENCPRPERPLIVGSCDQVFRQPCENCDTTVYVSCRCCYLKDAVCPYCDALYDQLSQADKAWKNIKKITKKSNKKKKYKHRYVPLVLLSIYLLYYNNNKLK